MIRTIPTVILLFSLLSPLFSSPAVILYGTSDSEKKVRELELEIQKVSESAVRQIRSTYDISKVLAGKPTVLLLVSDSAAAAYLRYAPRQESYIPTIVLCGIESYHSLKNQMPYAVFCVDIVSASGLMRQLSQFTGTIYSSAGFLFSPSKTRETAHETAQLRHAGITPYAVKVPDSASSGEIRAALLSLSEQGVTVVRILASPAVEETIATDPVLKEQISQQCSALLTTRSDFNRFLPETPTAAVIQNDTLRNRALALITASVLTSRTPSPDFTLSTHTVLLKYGTVRTEQISESRTALLSALDTLLRSYGKTVSGDSLRHETLELLGSAADSGVTRTPEQLIILSEAKTGIDRPVLWGFSVVDLLTGILGSIALLILLRIIVRIVSRLNKNVPLALLYPENVPSEQIRRSSTGKSRSLKRVLRREKFRMKTVKSLMQYRTFLEKNSADLHIIEWNSGSDVVVYLQHNFDRRGEKRTEPVVIYNIPRRYQLELFPRFSRTPLYMFENAFTREDLDRVFYGTGHQEYHVSTIAGSLAEESLPQILQALEGSAASGVLLIEDPEPFALIFYRNGLIVHAQDRFGSLQTEALFSALNKRGGTFRFEKDRRSPIEHTALTAMDILLLWASRSETAQ